jgi:hypothetical protein
MSDETSSAPGLDDLLRAWKAKGWPEDLLQSALDLHVPRRLAEWWLALGDRGLARAQDWVPQLQQLTPATIVGREATLLDNDRFSDLWANAPEEIGDWEITVERSPNAFAQFQLLENVSIPVLEERGVLLACVIWAAHNVIVGGKRLTVHCGIGLRVRREGRGKGYGNLVRAVSRPAWYPETSGQFHYMRSQNYAAVDFFKHTTPRVVASSPEREGDVPGIPVTVHQYPARATAGTDEGIRLARRSDLAACVKLINGTHGGQDLFSPYSVEALEMKLDGGAWGKQPAYRRVYGWSDFYAVERNGRIVACGGLWDRGRDIREHWRNRITGEKQTTSATAILDFGFEQGREADMAALIRKFIGQSAALGRDYLVAPLQQFPSVAGLLAGYRPQLETRALGWFLWDEYGHDVTPPDPPVERPYTDLAYW